MNHNEQELKLAKLFKEKIAGLVPNCPICMKHHVVGVTKAYVSDHVVSEIEYSCVKCGVVGYWAYGYFDPNGEYQG